MGITKKSNTHPIVVFFLSTTTVSETDQWCAKYVPIGSPHVTPYVSHIFCSKLYTCLYVSHILCPKVFFSSSSWFISFPFRSLYGSHILCPYPFFSSSSWFISFPFRNHCPYRAELREAPFVSGVKGGFNLPLLYRIPIHDFHI